jgi:hypothetical protein
MTGTWRGKVYTGSEKALSPGQIISNSEFSPVRLDGAAKTAVRVALDLLAASAVSIVDLVGVYRRSSAADCS